MNVNIIILWFLHKWDANKCNNSSNRIFKLSVFLLIEPLIMHAYMQFDNNSRFKCQKKYNEYFDIIFVTHKINKTRTNTDEIMFKRL